MLAFFCRNIYNNELQYGALQKVKRECGLSPQQPPLLYMV